MLFFPTLNQPFGSLSIIRKIPKKFFGGMKSTFGLIVTVNLSCEHFSYWTMLNFQMTKKSILINVSCSLNVRGSKWKTNKQQTMQNRNETKRTAGNVKWMKIPRFQSCPCPLEIHAKVNCLDRKYCHLSDKISFLTSHSNASCFYRCQPPPPPSLHPSLFSSWLEIWIVFVI